MMRYLQDITILLMVLGTSTSARAAPTVVLASSTFDANADGWHAVDRIAGQIPVTDYGVAPFNAAGGNPSGHISNEDRDELYYFRAPAKFLGNQSLAYGGTLSFEIKSNVFHIPVDPAGITRGVMLSNGATTIYRTIPIPSPDVWTPHSFSLNEAGWLDTATSSPITSVQMKSVLGGLTFLDILGEYGESEINDIGRLDNVRLIGIPEPGTVWLALMGALVINARRRFRN
jgi:hypothetical protein